MASESAVHCAPSMEPINSMVEYYGGRNMYRKNLFSEWTGTRK